MLKFCSASLACAFFVFTASAFAAGTFTVTNTNDAGAGSLRQVLLDVNAAGGGTVQFSIGSGPQTIQPQSAYPSSLTSIVIDGTTQPGYAGEPLIEVDGSLADIDFVDGLLQFNSGTVKGLTINNSTGAAVSLYSGQVLSCYIGTNAAGTATKPNRVGIRILSTNVLVEGNLISGNVLYGIDVMSGPVTIRGNRFGTDAGQTEALGGNVHIYAGNGNNFPGASPVVIGGTSPNTFAGGELGVYATYTKMVVIDKNYFGVTASGKRLPVRTAVSIYQSSDCVVTGNEIKGNDYGILITGTSLRNKISGNSIDDNTVGVELANYPYDGPTPNDDGDADTGPNNYINYPILTRVTSLDGTTTVAGTLNAAASRTFTIELYVSNACAAPGFGEGEQSVKTFTVTTGADGNAAFTQTFVRTLDSGDVMTAMATSDLEGTSEFSQCRIIEGRGSFSFPGSTEILGENETSREIAVLRTGGSAGAATVHYATSNGSAKAGIDYAAVSGTLSFADGETSKVITIGALDDGLSEGPQTFQIALSSASGAGLGRVQTIIVTINDDEPSTVPAIESALIFEGEEGTTPVSLSVSIAPPSDQPITVFYQTSQYTAIEGSDYVATQGSIQFAAGETTKQITVFVVGDRTRESDESFRVTPSINGSPGSYGVVTIRNDDPAPTVRIDDVTVAETDGETVATLTISATQPMTGEVRYDFSAGTATAGADFDSTSRFIQFSNAASRTFTIPIHGDTDPEGNETFTVTLTRWSGDFTFSDDRAVVTILDDDIGVGPSLLTLASGETEQITIRLGAPATQDLTVSVSTSAPEAVAVPSTVLISAGVSRVSFDVRALAPDRRVNITITFPASAGGTTSRVHVSTYSVAKLVFDPADLRLTPGQTFTVHATLQPAASEASTIRLSPTGGTVGVPSTLLIPAGGAGTFDVKALSPGPFVIEATLPPRNGSKTAFIAGRVEAAPTTPTILHVSPPDGPSSGGTRVDITGVLLRADCTVSFGGVPSTSIEITSETLLRAVTPSHSNGTVDVALSCGGDVSVLQNAFTFVIAGPRLTSIDPGSGSVRGGTRVQIKGANLHTSCWPFFDAVPAKNVIVRDVTSMTADTPLHGKVTANLSVRCTTGEATLPSAFAFNESDDPAPHIATVSPQFGTPGDLITIKGSNFRLDDAIVFADVPATSIDNTGTTHTLRVPDLSPGVVNISITNSSDRTSTTGPIFTVGEASPPQVTRVAPAAAPAGAEVELRGTGFRPGYTFAVGGRTAAIIALSPTRTVVRVSRTAEPGVRVVQTINALGHVASQGPSISILAGGLLVSSVTSRCATTEGNTDVVITGTGFTSDSEVTFDGIASPLIVFVDTSTIRARVPSGDSGGATIVVSNPDGAWATLSNVFRYDSPFDPGGCNSRTRAVRH